jgi:pyruvate, water dikinase
MKKYILWFKEISKEDVPLVGGKNASLGEMFSKLSKKGVQVPNGFAVTANAFRYYLSYNKIDKKLKEIFEKFNPKDIDSLRETGQKSRQLILKGKFPPDLKKEILENYQKLSKIYNQKNVDVAVRSSATAEDLATASFAGQHESYINISGNENVLKAVKKCFASLFTNRAIAYREEKGFDHLKVALSVCVQKMVRSDLASSGVMFTLDTETGFENVVLINSIFGQGEMIVKGKIIPDTFYVFKHTLKMGYKAIIRKDLGKKDRKLIYKKNGGLKEVRVSQKDQMKFSLSDEEILTLARWAMILQDHYGCHQDIEWAKDGRTNQLFIVQSRPETVHATKKERVYEEYEIKVTKKPILTGIAIGNKVGEGKVRILENISKIGEFRKGEVLVTKMTDPDWVPIMRMASAIITEEGGKTSHAAIVSRELGIPCVVGTLKATKVLKTGQEITVDCTLGSVGRVFLGKIPFKVKRYNLDKIPELETKIMVNIGAPDVAFKISFLPNEGVGLARIEFILAEKIRIHPLALYHFEKLKAQISKLKSSTQKSKIKRIVEEIEEITVEHKDKKEHFYKELAEGIAQIGVAFFPKPVIVRFSDFKSNEYRQLIGGELFEPEEANPMLGWRGASRYYDPKFQPAFEMECKAIKRVREEFGLKNIWVMVPFCRTPEEGKKVLELMKKFGLERGKDGLKVICMCEIPSNVILAEKFLEIFDGFSIGSNDLTQLVLGLDRDSALVSRVGNEMDESVKEMVKRVVEICQKKKKYCGICGDAPSTYPEFAKFLVNLKIPTISLSPDAVMKTILNLTQKRS